MPRSRRSGAIDCRHDESPQSGGKFVALINRVTKLFQADINAVLDRIEEPEVVLKQALREMEESLAAEERRLESMRIELGDLAQAHRPCSAIAGCPATRCAALRPNHVQAANRDSRTNATARWRSYPRRWGKVKLPSSRTPLWQRHPHLRRGQSIPGHRHHGHHGSAQGRKPSDGAI